MQLICADCVEAMKGMADNSVDAIVTDPPYGTASESKVQKHGDNPLTDFNLEWDVVLPVQWLVDAYRVCVAGGACIAFTDNREVTTLWRAMEAAGWRPLQTLTWVKSNPPPQPRQNFCSGVETAIFARKPGKVHCWNGGGATVNWHEYPLTSNSERVHPTQKPLALMSWLVSLVSDPGHVVLDPFCGSGTTGVACVNLGRNFIGIERDPAYFELMKTRIETRQTQTRLL